MNVGRIEGGIPSALRPFNHGILDGQQPFPLKGMTFNRPNRDSKNAHIHPGFLHLPIHLRNVPSSSTINVQNEVDASLLRLPMVTNLSVQPTQNVKSVLKKRSIVSAVDLGP